MGGGGGGVSGSYLQKALSGENDGRADAKSLKECCTEQTFFFFFFFAFPSYISGVHHFWVRFLRM